jgi:hypothetical protein
LSIVGFAALGGASIMPDSSLAVPKIFYTRSGTQKSFL